jgi:hypothetical protein
MRTTRALIAGIGTTGSLVAAAACVFVVASAVIAFKGWPTGLTESIDNLMVNDAPPVAWDVPGTQAVAASAVVAAGAVAPAPAGPAFGVAGVGLAGDGTPILTGPTIPEGTVPAGTIPAAVATGTDAGLGSATGPTLPDLGSGSLRGGVADTARDVTAGTGRTVRETAGVVGGAVGGDLGAAVTETGSGLGDTVERAGAVADGILRQP